MSFRTYADVNNDNVVRILEENDICVNAKEDSNMKNNAKSVLKNAVGMYADFFGTGKKTWYEPLVSGGWFDWSTRRTIPTEEFESLVHSVTEKEMNITYVG